MNRSVSFFLHLKSMNVANDGVTNEVKYHLKCWVQIQREANPASTKPREIQKFTRVISDIKMINVSN